MTDIFISYNHKDEAWKDELQSHLKVLQYHCDFSVWEDRQIKAGDNWLPEIENAIQSAKIAILLVSRDFLTSDFVTRKEIPDLLKRREDDGLRVIPLVIRPCAWRTVPWLAALQGGTKDNKPLARFAIDSNEVEEALADFTHVVYQQLLDLREVDQCQLDEQNEQQVLQEKREAEEQQREREEEECQTREAELLRKYSVPVFPARWAADSGEDQYGLWQALVYKDVRYVFRWMQPGTFMMGSPNNEVGRYKQEDLHEVTLSKGFWLGETTVTQALWQAVAGESPSYFHGEQLPVETVSWDDCQVFIRQLNQYFPELRVRLPWEAEWEYACRAGTATPFYFGGKAALDLGKVNYSGKWDDWNNKGKTETVKSYSPNPWGLYDMHGNVWEWCQDEWQTHLGTKPVTDPQGSAGGDQQAGRVIRGGSWNGRGRRCRSAYRSGGAAVNRHNGLGFRLSLGH